MAKQLTLNARDIDALSRISHAEARSLGPEGIAGVVGTILNRVAAGGYGNGIEGVINKPWQFSPINSVGHWSRLPEASADTKSIVQQIVAQMRDGAANPVGNSTHFYNPAIASPKWGKQMDVLAQFGEGRNQHIHGTLPTDAKPPTYTVAVGNNVPLSQIAGTGDRPVPPRDIPNVTLAEGSKGSAVRALQTQLNDMGAGLKVDGVFGPRTEAAVQNFQTVTGIKADGVWGPQSRQAFADLRIPGAPTGPTSAAANAAAQEFSASRGPYWGDTRGGPAAFNMGTNQTSGPGMAPYNIPFASRAVGSGNPMLNSPTLWQGTPLPTAGAFTGIDPSKAKSIRNPYGGNDPEGGPGAAYEGGAGGGTSNRPQGQGGSLQLGGRSGGGGGADIPPVRLFNNFGAPSMAAHPYSANIAGGKAPPMPGGIKAPGEFFPPGLTPENLDESILLQQEIYRLQNPFGPQPNEMDDPWNIASTGTPDYTRFQPENTATDAERLQLMGLEQSQQMEPSINPWDVGGPAARMDQFPSQMNPNWAQDLLSDFGSFAPTYNYGVPELPSLPSTNPTLDPQIFDPSFYSPGGLGTDLSSTPPTVQPTTPTGPTGIATGTDFGLPPGVDPYPVPTPPPPTVPDTTTTGIDTGPTDPGSFTYSDYSDGGSSFGPYIDPSSYIQPTGLAPDWSNYQTSLNQNQISDIVNPGSHYGLTNLQNTNNFLEQAANNITLNNWLEANNSYNTNMGVISGYTGSFAPFGIYG